MELNTQFGKLNANNNIEYAPKAFKFAGKDYLHPTSEDYVLAGYLPVNSDLPVPPTGYHYVDIGWKIENQTICHDFTLVEDIPNPQPKIPRKFSKLKIVGILTQLGFWPQVKEYLIDNDLYDMYLAAQVFQDDNEYFNNGLLDLKDMLGISDNQLEEMLESCIVEY